MCIAPLSLPTKSADFLAMAANCLMVVRPAMIMGLLFAICRIYCARSISCWLPPINTWQAYSNVRRSASSANRSGGQALNQYRVPGVVVCHCVFLSVQEDFHSLLERKT